MLWLEWPQTAKQHFVTAMENLPSAVLYGHLLRLDLEWCVKHRKMLDPRSQKTAE